MTRLIQDPQLQFGQVDISQIKFNPKSRDDIPKILRGLQYIYTTSAIRERIFNLLEENISPEVNKNTGRPGMALWKIFVMGVLRLDLNCDYDRLQELVNHHDTIREMLGHSAWEDNYEYQMQTIKDNVGLLTPKLLEKLNQVIVDAGHGLVKKKESAVLHGRCDSYVVETHVHYPTDITLLFDAIRKVIQLTARLCEHHGVSDWRQSVYQVKKIKRQMRKTQKKKRASGRSEPQKEKCAQAVKDSHQTLIVMAQSNLDKAKNTLKTLQDSGSFMMKDLPLIELITEFGEHVDRQIDQIKRRVLEEKVISHEEKVFSIFQPHTEWISKGKAGVPVELGIRVCILEDQHQFILHHRVMEKETDDRVAIPMVVETKAQFPNLESCSFDKAFHSQKNQEKLSEALEVVALKRKGKLSEKSRAIESSAEFKQAAHKHSAVESAINALEVHGLDICKDHGIDGFKRYVALGIVTRNIHRVGHLLHQKEQKRLARKRNHSRDGTLKLAA